MKDKKEKSADELVADIVRLKRGINKDRDAVKKTIEAMFLLMFTMAFVLIISAIWSLVWSWPMMWAWNYVMPAMFGLSTITYWQMFALYFILCGLWKVVGVSGK